MNLTNFKTYVKYDLKRTDKDTEIVQALNDMILFVAAKLPMGAYKYQSYIALVAGQEDYPLPSTLMHVLHPVKYLEGSATSDSGWPLERISKQEYDERFINPNRTSPDDTGEAGFYCIFGGCILIGPIPESGTNDLLEMDWTTRPTDLSADADTPALGDEWREVLKCGVLARVNAGIELFQEAAYWESQYLNPVTKEPIGMFKSLLDAEREREEMPISHIRANEL